MPFSPRLLTKEWTIDVLVQLVWDVLARTDKLINWIEYPFEWVRERRYVVQEWSPTLRGITEPLTLRRLRPE